MNSPAEIQSFKKSLRRLGLLVTGLLLLGLLVGIITKFSLEPGVIGWGITLGTPLILGFYAGLFAWVGEVDSKDPEKTKKRLSFLKFFKRTGISLGALIILLFGYFMLDKAIKGTEISQNFFNQTLSGLYCSVMAVLVFAVPMILSALITLWVGRLLRKWIVRHHLRKIVIPSLLLPLLLPLALDGLEAKLGNRTNLPEESILTQRDLAATILSTWHHLQYYEKSGTEAPLLFVLGFPKPLRTEGTINKPGDITRCVYDKGYLIKETTSVELSDQYAHLKFKVLEQHNIEDRAIELTKGSFELTMTSKSHMTLKLKTHYKPLMTPRWIWRPVEQLTARALRNHVIDQISDQQEAMQRVYLKNASR